MKARHLTIGALVAVVALVVWLVASGDDDAYTVRAELPNAGGLRVNSSVKVAGVSAGVVKDLEVTDRDTAMATLELQPEAAPIGRGASAAIRPTDLLGERYVALDLGDQRRPEPSGATIGRARTTLPVELDDILNTFDADTRTRMEVLINEFGVALGSRGKDLAKLLDAMPASLDDARALLAEITRENASLGRLIDQGDRVAASVNGKQDDLVALIDQAETTLGELAERRQALGAAIDSAPGGLARLRTTLGELRATAVALRPAAADLQRAAPPLTDALDAVPGFEDAARESLRAAQDAAPKLTKLGRDGLQPIQRLAPTLRTLRTVSDEATRALDHLDRRGFEDVLWFAQNWSLGLKNRDGLGHFVGAKVSVGVSTVTSVLDSMFNGGTPVDQDPDAALRRRSTARAAATAGGRSPVDRPAAADARPGGEADAKPLLQELGDRVVGALTAGASTTDKHERPGALGGVTGLLDGALGR